MNKLKEYIQEKLVINKNSKIKNYSTKSINEFVEKYHLKDISTTNNVRFGKYRYEFTVDNDVVSEAIKFNIFDRWDSGSYQDQKKFTEEIEQFGTNNFHWSDVSVDIFISDKNSYTYTSYLCIYETEKNTDLIKISYRSDYDRLDIIVKDDDMREEYESWMIQILEYIINKDIE